MKISSICKLSRDQWTDDSQWNYMIEVAKRQIHDKTAMKIAEYNKINTEENCDLYGKNLTLRSEMHVYSEEYFKEIMQELKLNYDVAVETNNYAIRNLIKSIHDLLIKD